MARAKLLLLSRDTLAAYGEHGEGRSDEAEKVYRLLAGLHRHGVYLLLTAPAPDSWVPTKGGSDASLALQREIQAAVWDAGAEMDGIYYVPRSLLTQDRNRIGALRDILERYKLDGSETLLISGSTPFLKAADRLGIRTVWVSDAADDDTALTTALEGELASEAHATDASQPG